MSGTGLASMNSNSTRAGILSFLYHTLNSDVKISVQPVRNVLEHSAYVSKGLEIRKLSLINGIDVDLEKLNKKMFYMEKETT